MLTIAGSGGAYVLATAKWGTLPNAMKLLEIAREAFARKAWADSVRLFEAADRESALEPEDLERLATAAYLIGRDEESETCLTRAHQIFLDRDDREGAARSAAWLAFGLMRRGASAPASGWFARAGRILDESQLESVVRGYLLIPTAIRHIVQGKPDAALDAFKQSAEIARRFVDRDLASFACQAQGRALIHMGQLHAGAALLDEAMTAVVAGDVSPQLAGDIYCSVLESCQETFDLRRAFEWTIQLTRWCAEQEGLVRYRGECLSYRAEIMQLRGRWRDAEQDAEAACTLLMSRPAVGKAIYRCAEIHRLRGEFDKAEAAYARANERGLKPQPGLSLLRLAQGQIDSAAGLIRGALLDTQDPVNRIKLLASAVEILLAAEDVTSARAAAVELSQVATDSEASILSAASAHATGAVLLAEGDIAGAAISLQQALEIWRSLAMPYEEAHTCLLVAAVCARRGDLDGRRLELETARRLFTELDASPSLARLGDEPERPTHQSARPLSERELQVLRLLATGKSNRDIAHDLFISEKTVARHVSNIFDKIGASSRSAATAWAYESHLV